MRVIVRSAVFLLAFAIARADPPPAVMDVVSSMAAALVAVNIPEFMNAIDRDMPGYDQLQTDITALVSQADVASSIEVSQDSGDASRWVMDLDWFLEVRSLVQDGPVVHRRAVIHCELRKQKKGWKVVSMKPIDFFAPPPLDK